jgi:hypothetical protein
MKRWAIVLTMLHSIIGGTHFSIARLRGKALIIEV